MAPTVPPSQGSGAFIRRQLDARFWLSGAELRVKKPFLVRRAGGRKSGDGLVCVCVWI
jgi:hypothetical protein